MFVQYHRLLTYSVLALVPCLGWGGERPVTGPKPMEPMILTPENLPEGLGKEVINDSCTSCHELGQLTNDQHSAQEWASIVEQIVGGQGVSIPTEPYYPLISDLIKNLAVPAPASE